MVCCINFRIILVILILQFLWIENTFIEENYDEFGLTSSKKRKINLTIL
jgi:hypothetical protein